MIRHPAEEYDKEYREFQQQEDIPVHTGMVIDDVRTVETGKWERTGGRGTFLNLLGMEKTCDAQIHEIPPGETLHTQRHLHDALVFVISGSGLTKLGTEDEYVFEWDSSALFYLPENTEYQHVNINESEPLRLLAITSLPLLYSVHRNHEVIWDNDSYSEWSSADEDFYETKITEVQSGSGRGSDKRAYWEANYVPDVAKFDKLETWPERGGGGKNVNFPFRSSSMYAHISEFPSGKYKKAHRHHPGANVLMLTGEGYSLLWREKHDDRHYVEWSPYTLFTPPTLWFHQHFNTSEQPTRYLAMHAPQLGMRAGENAMLDSMDSVNQIEYPDEDPEIRDKFQQALVEKGIENKMNPQLYQNSE